MRGIGDELPQLGLAPLLGRQGRTLLVEGLLDAIQHRVQRFAETADLAAVVLLGNPLGHVPGRDLSRGGSHRLERSKSATEEPPADDEERDEDDPADDGDVADQRCDGAIDRLERGRDNAHRAVAIGLDERPVREGSVDRRHRDDLTRRRVLNQARRDVGQRVRRGREPGRLGCHHLAVSVIDDDGDLPAGRSGLDFGWRPTAAERGPDERPAHALQAVVDLADEVRFRRSDDQETRQGQPEGEQEGHPEKELRAERHGLIRRRRESCSRSPGPYGSASARHDRSSSSGS